MIAYDLQCIAGHSFEGWFEEEKAYLKQKKKGLVSCPVCNDTSVSRVPSTFGIKTSEIPTGTDRHLKKYAQVGKKIINFVEKNFDDVGCNFANEALKMHYGATEPRSIRGISTKEEEKSLKEEGVEFFKFPIPIPPETDS